MPLPSGGGNRQYSSPGYPLFKLHGSRFVLQGFDHEARRSEQASGKRAAPPPIVGASGAVFGLSAGTAGFIAGVLLGFMPGVFTAGVVGVTFEVGEVGIAAPAA